jgi:hypothetical protein
MTTAMDDDQRSFLLEDWRGFVADLETDVDEQGRFGPGTAHFLHHLKELIAWLEGGSRPGADTRRFVEERLDAYDETFGYDRIVLGHGALAAVIEELL